MRPIELDEAAYHQTGEIRTRISATSRSVAADRVVLATGFLPQRPGGEVVRAAIEALDLPLAPDGYPVVDDHLRWRPGLFVMGPLAELVVGPASRNLSGARMAAQRIVESPELGVSLHTCSRHTDSGRTGSKHADHVAEGVVANRGGEDHSLGAAYESSGTDVIFSERKSPSGLAPGSPWGTRKPLPSK